jgi:hypothetical protein
MPAVVSALALAKMGRWLCSKWKVDDALPAGRICFGTSKDRKMAIPSRFETAGLLLSRVSTVSDFARG